MKFSKIFLMLVLIPFSILCDEISDAVNNIYREESNIERDRFRNPYETLTFFEIKKDMNVLEILPGRGWYTEILSQLLKDSGQLTVASFGSDHQIKYLRDMHNKFFEKFKEQDKYGKIKFDVFFNDLYFPNIQSSSQDIILTFRNNHNWIKSGNIKDIYLEIYKKLKNDGILGVVQHRSLINSFDKPEVFNGYVSENYLIKLIEECGFKLIEKSEINANPNDTKNHEDGVWSLPPTLRSGKKKLYLNIGESDRMTLKFKKN